MTTKLGSFAGSHPRLAALPGLAVGAAVIVQAVMVGGEPTTRTLLALAGAFTLSSTLRIMTRDLHAGLQTAFTGPLLEPVGAGFSYGEVRGRLVSRLRWTTRSLLALMSLFIIGQVLAGFLLMGGSPLTMLAVETTMWSGFVLGLHLGWRSFRAVRQAGRLRYEIGY